MYGAGLILLLVFAIIPIYSAQLVCDSTMCNNVCILTSRTNGTCVGTTCQCNPNKKCSDLGDLKCDVFCKVFQLTGECKNDQCLCKAELELCKISDCTQQCREDPRGQACIAKGCILTPTLCLEYGPVRTCNCLCTCPGASAVGDSSPNAFKFRTQHIKSDTTN